MRLVPALALSLAVVTAAPRAQEPESADPWSLIPEDAFLVAWCDGPAKLREAFAGTRLGRAVGGPEMSGKLAPLLETLRAELENAGLDQETAEKTIREYGGRVLFAFGFDFDKLAAAAFAGRSRSPVSESDFWMLMVLAADGQTDFEQLLRMTEERSAQKAQEQGVELVDLRVAGKVVRAERGEGQEPEGTLPFLWGGNLVMIGGADLERAVERSLLPAGKTMADRAIARASGNAGMWVATQGAMSAFFARLEEEAPDPDAIRAALDATGIRAFDTMSFTAEPAGEHMRFEMRGDFTEDASGLLGAFMVESDEPPRALDLVPVQRESWSVSRWDPQALYSAFGEIADAITPFTGRTRTDLEDAFAEFTRVRLAEDLIAHLGGELLNVSDGTPIDFGDLENEGELEGGACWGVTLDDPQAFGASLEKMIRSRGLHVSRKSEDYRGFAVQRLAFGRLQVYYTVSERALLVGLGEAGAQQVRAVLDEERDRAEGKPRAALPAEIQRRLEHAVSGWNGLGAGSMVRALEAYRAIRRALPDQPTAYGGRSGARPAVSMREIGERFDEVLEIALQLVTRYELETMVVASKTGRRGFAAQMIW
jgi:hypothetical protein